MPGKHALLSASKSNIWLKCTPSARLEEAVPNSSSIYAAEGTAAHELAEYKLNKYLGIDGTRPVSEFHGEELEENTDKYVEFATSLIHEARATCDDTMVLVEEVLDYSCYAQGGFGTGDLVIVTDQVLHICDFKYGNGIVVSAVGNSQMMLYALGALSLVGCLYNIKKIKMTIYQPRLDNISTDEIPVEQLMEWVEKELIPKANLAIKGEGDFLPGNHCQFCKARKSCKARSAKYLSLAKHEFKEPTLLTYEQVEEVLNVSQNLEAWVKEVKAYATNLAVNYGKVWTGFKLVESRTNRKYIDEDKVIEACHENEITDIYERKLKSVSNMEKFIGEERFKSVFGALIIKPKGEPTLVPNSDKRKAIIIKNTAEADFREE